MVTADKWIPPILIFGFFRAKKLKFQPVTPSAPGVLAALLCVSFAAAQNLTVQDILALPVPPADHHIPYGSDPLQFGELRLPRGPGPRPVVIVIHGGCWHSRYDLSHITSLCAALTAAGVATWSLEYRRVGNPGGGWPGTFQDIASGADFVRTLAASHPLDLRRVVAVGHSAGGHLALWLAARRRLPKESALYTADPLALRGVVALAGVPDLREAVAREPRLCGGILIQLLGGSPTEVPDRYREASPIALLPLGTSQRLINGARDQIVPLELGKSYEAAARKTGDDVKLIVLDEAGHFEMIAPQSFAWPAVKEAVLSLVSP